ncbi:hypothetical protein ACOJ84_003735 [Morganella morganii]|uniref:hypothetical protein n=1 Tax=Morganella morganii TaxID=582 RepID=UPI00055ED319|nr:hypothetical protein [Morganella morganii]OVF52944.1 hypothetical protein B5724_14290 [Morganella morganii]RTY20462.1 hypothetical protein EKS23_11390 [Morganella morganii subsp. morganii]HBC7443491.1 hypothetical protein [Morganella morganii]HCU2394953.1 hypothetical protein [Morganella morganii]HED1571094.1 hypothetical protein [Morganella morganii]
MKKVLIALIISLVSFGSLARDLTPAEVTAVERAVREEMKDPDAAKFYHGDFPKTETNSLYCGMVNGKNSYGAYTGKKLFSAFIIEKDDGGVGALSMDRNMASGEPLSQDVIAASCAGAGYPTKVNKIFVGKVNEARSKNGLPALTKAQIE